MSMIDRPRRSGEHRTSAASRERILDAAFEVIRDEGYSGATMAKVAKKAELPVGSVYWHFENKDMLLAAMIDTSYARWHAEVATAHQPGDGEAFAAHIGRVFGADADRQYDAADFWRLGVILSVEKSVREQVARDRFLKIRQLQRAEFASWWRKTLPPALVAHDPELPDRLSGFALALQDGNAIAGASGEPIKAFRPMLASSLVSLVEQAAAALGAVAGAAGKRRNTPEPSHTARAAAVGKA